MLEGVQTKMRARVTDEVCTSVCVCLRQSVYRL